MSDAVTLVDWVSAALLVAGAAFSLVAGVGLLVLPDLLARMHAAAKPQVLGLLLLLTGLGLRWGSWAWVPVLVLAWVMQMVTAPVASHLVARTGYRTKHGRRLGLARDDLARAARRVVPDAGRPRPASTDAREREAAGAEDVPDARTPRPRGGDGASTGR